MCGDKSREIVPEKTGWIVKGLEICMCKVLLLDKDDIIRMLYREIIEEGGFSVVDTGNREMLREMIEEESPDIVVMGADQDPRASLDLLQSIRSLYNALPIILCTTYNHVKNNPKALLADCVLYKRSDTGELLKSRIQMIWNAMTSTMRLGSAGTNLNLLLQNYSL